MLGLLFIPHIGPLTASAVAATQFASTMFRADWDHRWCCRGHRWGRA